MKKFVSVVLALTMVVSMFATASAYPVSHYIDTPESENFMEYQLPIYVEAKKTSDADVDENWKNATEGLEILSDTLKTVDGGVSVDFRATLDMQQICDVFDGDFYRLVSLADDFDTGKVSTSVNVTVEYDKGTIEDATAKTEGSLLNSANDVYTQVGERTVASVNDKRNKITINFKQKTDNVSVTDLIADKNAENKYFSDITFDLPGAVKYSNDGYYNVQVTLTGKTTFTFGAGSEKTIVNIGYSNKVATENDDIGTGNFIVSAATEHLLAIEPAKAATCTTNAWTEAVYCKSHKGKSCAFHGRTHNGYDCGVMGTYEAAEIPNTALAHKNAIKFVPEVPATCAAVGVKAHYTCTLCKKDFKDEAATQDAGDLTLPKSDTHTYGTITAGHTATCTMDGLTALKQCEVCGHKDGGTVTLATGHSIVIDNAVAATCTTDGKTEGKHCLNCAYVIAQRTTPALGHSYGEWEITTEATEEHPGEMTRTCLNCGTPETETIPQLPPSHTCAKSDTSEDIKPATCDATGLKQYYCECGLPFGSPEEIPALGHNAEEQPAVPATCTDKGVRHHWKCSRCAKLFSDANATKVLSSAETPVDSKAHGDENLIDILEIKPTCYTVGWSLGKKCVKCDTITIRPTLKPITHDLEEISAQAATCTEKGIVKHWHCKSCNKDFEDEKATILMAESEYTIAPLGHTWGEPEDPANDAPEHSDEFGKFVYTKRTCSRAGCVDDKVKVRIEEHVHNEAVYKLVKNADCKKNEHGRREKVYTCCNEEYVGADKIEIIDVKTAHNLKRVEGIAATCAKEGMTKHLHCSICGRNFKTNDAWEVLEEISGEVKLAKTTDHDYQVSKDGKKTEKKCTKCHKKVKAQDNTGGKIDVNNVELPNKVRVHEKEKELDEDREMAESQGQAVIPETDFTFDEIGLSETLEAEISKGSNVVEEKLVLDIGLKANNKVVDNLGSQNIVSQNKEILDELPDDQYLIVPIKIPVNMQGKNDYRVYRLHNGTHTANDVITTIANYYGEKIEEIDTINHIIKIKVRKFSEYALVAYEATQPPVVYPDPNPAPSTGGGGGSSSLSIKFNSNGGTVTPDMSVKRGGKVSELPVPTRDGFVFAGWYLDSAFTTPFDTDTVINRNYTLYAKWVELGDCEGTVEDNCPCLKYYDLDPTMWYHRGVDYVLNRGMMNGVADTQFAPDWDVTRAMLVTVLWRAEGKPAGANTTFTDLEDGLYYVDAVKWAAANGVVNGYSDTVFAPNDAITREQFAAIMYRYAKAKGYDVTAGENTNILSYSDYDAISEYAIEAMQYTLGSGLIKGRTETTLNPKDNTTRAEMATILYRFFTESK